MSFFEGAYAREDPEMPVSVCVPAVSVSQHSPWVQTASQCTREGARGLPLMQVFMRGRHF